MLPFAPLSAAAVDPSDGSPANVNALHNAAFLQEKLVPPLLEEFFYKRGYGRRATTAISVEKVMDAVITQLDCFGCQRTLSVSMATLS